VSTSSHSESLDSSCTFQNEHLNVTVITQPNCFVQFDITVSEEATRAAHQKAIKTINKEIVIPGFRKGRAPDQLIIQKYGSSIQQEFIDIVLQTAFQEAVRLTHIHPLKEGVLKRPVIKSCTLEGAHFTIEFERQPIIPTVSWTDIKLTEPATPNFTEEAMEEALQQTAASFATYEKVEGRTVQEGDCVDFHLNMLEDPSVEVVRQERIRVDQKNLPHWLFEKILDVIIGEQKEVIYTKPQEEGAASEDTDTISYLLVVDAIWKQIIPSIDELPNLMKLSTLEECRQKITTFFENDVKEFVYQNKLIQLEQILLEKYSFDIPNSYIENSRKASLDSYIADLEGKNQYIPEKHHEYEKEIEKSLADRIKLILLFQQVELKQNITVDQEDLMQEFTRQLQLSKTGNNAIDFNSGNKEELSAQLHRITKDHKTKRFIINQISTSQ
jgi:trigger factor